MESAGEHSWIETAWLCALWLQQQKCTLDENAVLGKSPLTRWLRHTSFFSFSFLEVLLHKNILYFISSTSLGKKLKNHDNSRRGSSSFRVAKGSICPPGKVEGFPATRQRIAHAVPVKCTRSNRRGPATPRESIKSFWSAYVYFSA